MCIYILFLLLCHSYSLNPFYCDMQNSSLKIPWSLSKREMRGGEGEMCYDYVIQYKRKETYVLKWFDYILGEKKILGRVPPSCWDPYNSVTGTPVYSQSLVRVKRIALNYLQRKRFEYWWRAEYQVCISVYIRIIFAL